MNGCTVGQLLRVLIVEDSERDAALLVRELNRGGYELAFERVETPEAMRAALQGQTWDIMISDYSLPHFSALAAIEVIRQTELDLPIIIVSGTVGEEIAVEAMRAGAHDFMPKGQFTRLLPAIARELREAARRAEHRAVERQLHEAQKMESIGQLTGGIAHDFNNLLGVIVGSLDLLIDLVEQDSVQTELANDALTGALRGAELTKRLLAFARRQPLSNAAVDLNERLPNVIEVLRRTLGEGIQIIPRQAPDLWFARVDPSQIDDVLLNLAINARDAMPNGGTLTIETANMHLDEQYAAVRAEIAPGDYVMLSVSDTGIGMPPDVMERATEPFFTTKEPGKGTGLGLSMIYGFAKQSGGHLSIYSEIDVGTTIRIYLPRALNEAPVKEAEATGSAELPGGSETILVVDDNAALRRVAVHRLSGLGYTLREAENGPAALAIVEGGGRIDLLFTDIGMPGGMSGYELANLAVQRQRWLKVLFTTGYGNMHLGTGHEPEKLAIVLRKPYRAQELAEKVRTALDTSS
jgi:signal transduction histidine kinase